MKFTSNTWYVLGIIAVCLVTLHPYINSYDHFTNYVGDIDIGNFITTNHIAIHDSFTEYGQFPLWNMYTLSGTPLFAGPQVGVLSLTTLLVFFVPTVYAAVKLSLLFYAIIAGIGMYLFAQAVGLEKKYAFFAALAYIVNGTAGYFFYSYTFWSAAYAFLPFILLFTKLAFEKDRILYGSFAGVLLGLVFLSGAISGFLYVSLLFGLYCLFFIWGNNFVKRIRDVAIVAGFIILVASGVLAIKALPSQDFVSKTYRSGEFDYDFFLGNGHHLTGDRFFSYLIKDLDRPFPTAADGTGQIGFVAAFLVLLSLMYWKKKKVLFFQIALIFLILYMMRSPISWFVWKFVPIFSQQKNLDKALFLFNFCAALLAGFGLKALFDYIKEKSSLLFRKSTLIFAVILVLFFLDMGFLNLFTVMLGGGLDRPYNIAKFGNYYDMPQDISENAILQRIASGDDLFRTKFHHVNAPYDGSNSFTIPLSLHDVYGNGNLYHAQYPFFGLVAEQTGARSKMYGMLNVKYLVSRDELDLDGFSLVDEFDAAQDSFYGSQKVAYGPYLYENTEVLPRAYNVDSAVLVLGSEDAARQTIYGILSSEEFDPTQTVLVFGGATPSGDLSKYDGILLLQGANPGNLAGYGGKVVPDIRLGETQATQKDVVELFAAEDDSGVAAAEVVSYSPNKVTVGADAGWLVVSEKYSLFDGWHAKGSKEYEIEEANGVLSAVYLPSPDTVTFSYWPSGFANGMWITLLTVFALLGYYGYRISLYLRRPSQKTDSAEDKTTP